MADKDPTLASGVLSSMSQTPPNPYGADPKDLDAYAKAQQAAIDALQHRYDKPNWFNIAGAFGKPQLGGFFASLGNVGQVMGEQQERQRDAAVQAQLLGTQLAQTRILQGQNKRQADILSDWQSRNYTPSPAEVAAIMALNPHSSVASSVEKLYPNMVTAQAIQSNQAEAVRQHPELMHASYQASIGENAGPEKYKEYAKTVDASRPPQIDPLTWNSMMMDDKVKAVADYGRTQREAGMSQDEALRQQAEKAPERMALLQSIRDLAVGKGVDDIKNPDGTIKKTGQQQMAEALGYLQGSSAIDAIGKAANEGKFKDWMSGFSTYASRIGLSTQANDQMQKLAKLLAENQIEMRNFSSNPTDQFSLLQRQGSPSMDNSQLALVALTDLMAHSEKVAQEKYKFLKEARKTRTLPYGQLENDKDYLDLLSRLSKEHAQIVTSNPLMGLPQSYVPSSSSVTGTKAGQSSGKTTASRTPPAGWIKNADGTFSKVKP